MLFVESFSKSQWMEEVEKILKNQGNALCETFRLEERILPVILYRSSRDLVGFCQYRDRKQPTIQYIMVIM